MARIVADLHKLNDELRESGSWVFTGGLHAPTSATVVRADGMITDIASTQAATDPDPAEHITRSIPRQTLEGEGAGDFITESLK